MIPKNKEPEDKTMAKTLIAFFSRADENYFGGAMRWVDVGNTEIVCNIIKGLIPADSFKIEMKTPYSPVYMTCIEEAKNDLRKRARPELEIHKKQAKNGGAMISFELTEEYDIKKFFPRLKLITLAESLGGVESLVCHPASMTHASIPRELRLKLGITDNLIRLSVGIENASDLISDLKQAIDSSRI